MVNTSTSKRIIGYTDLEYSDDIDNRIRFILSRLGLRANHKGFKMLVSAIHKMALDPDKYIGCITKSLYIDIADEFKTTWCCVERCMRFSIASSKYADSMDCLKYLGNLDQPCNYTNSEFISTVAQLIRFNINK